MKHLNFIFLFFLVSCAKERDIILPNESTSLVVNCLFNPDSTWKLYLSSTIILGQSSNEMPRINNAKVFLFENDILIDTLENTASGIYTNTLKPAVGLKYKIKIEAEGFQSVEATDSIPINKGMILSGTLFPNFVQKKAPPPWIDLLDYVKPFTLKIASTINQKQYYKLQGLIIPINPIQYPTIVIDSGLVATPLQNINSEDKRVASISWEQSFLLFDNSTFDDVDYVIECFYSSTGLSHSNGIETPQLYPLFVTPIYLDPFYINIGSLTTHPAPAANTGEWELDYYAELITLSENYYKHTKSRLLQQYNIGIPGSDFNNVHSNIINGKGIFGGYQVHKYKLQ